MWWGVPGWLIPLGVAWLLLRGRRGRPERWGADRQAELDELRTRVAELERDRDRMAELKERLDFTERMLSRGRAEVPLSKGN